MVLFQFQKVHPHWLLVSYQSEIVSASLVCIKKNGKILNSLSFAPNKSEICSPVSRLLHFLSVRETCIAPFYFQIRPCRLRSAIFFSNLFLLIVFAPHFFKIAQTA